MKKEIKPPVKSFPIYRKVQGRPVVVAVADSDGNFTNVKSNERQTQQKS